MSLYHLLFLFFAISLSLLSFPSYVLVVKQIEKKGKVW